MEQSFGSEFIFNDDEFVGLYFGADYCAEHEWGIDDLKDFFGIKDSEIGLAKRKITDVPSLLEWVENKKFSGFWIKHWEDSKVDVSRISNELRSNEAYTAWDKESFGIFSNRPEFIEKLKEIFKALSELDAAIWLGGGGVFKNSGLIICIASKIPQETIKDWEEKDTDREKILAEFKATGIEERLAAAGREYFALSPRRDADGSLIFWLNPQEQHKNNFGWFKISDLEDWINNKGKVIIK